MFRFLVPLPGPAADGQAEISIPWLLLITLAAPMGVALAPWLA